MHTSEDQVTLSNPSERAGVVLRGAIRACDAVHALPAESAACAPGSALVGSTPAVRREGRAPAPHDEHRPFTPEIDPLPAEACPQEAVWKGAARLLAGRARSRSAHPAGAVFER